VPIETDKNPALEGAEKVFFPQITVPQRLKPHPFKARSKSEYFRDLSNR
jgi:hypothetical protein